MQTKGSGKSIFRVPRSKGVENTTVTDFGKAGSKKGPKLGREVSGVQGGPGKVRGLPENEDHSPVTEIVRGKGELSYNPRL